MNQNEVFNTHTRAHIRLSTQAEAMDMVSVLSKYSDKFFIENKDASSRVNAKSIIGTMYFMFDLNDEMYLVNDTHDGLIPSALDRYRVIA
jgi:phosphotransferase system HPr-like phosphotransfer protein